MTIPLEDGWEDIVDKAARGLGKSASELARETGLDVNRVAAALRAEPDEEALRQLAPALNLHPDSLVRLARGNYHPDTPAPEGLVSFSFPFPVPGYAEMRVNAYLVHAPGSSETLIFDCGGKPEDLTTALTRDGLTAAALFLTHAHRDHVAGINQLAESTGAPVYAPKSEPFGRASPIAPGERLTFGPLVVTARDTSGHSPGGTTYVIEGAGAPLAIVGDALFAGSVGGAPYAWNTALERVRKNILSLPDDTVLCPGHGPITTVAKEKENNPVFPEFK